MQLRNRIKVLKALLRLVEDEITLETHHEGQPSEFWSDLHQDVVRVSKELFKDCHYAEAVEAAFKKLNRKVKQHVREKTGQDLDGADLMHQAFTTKNRAPIITLADLSTEDGRSIQQGYMEIFAGAMTGIRNPKAHSNIKIDQNRALHFLYLASLLHQIFDERL
ncbi:MAG: TIGR02391 family protein, partial [Chthoniobacterales bacterium]